MTMEKKYMNANTGGGIWRQLRNGLTDRGFLKRIGVTRKAMQAAFEAARLKAAAEKINEQRLGSWDAYYERLAPLQQKGLLELPQIPGECRHNAHMFYLVCRKHPEC